MSPDAPEAEKVAPEAAPETAAATDEDVLRLRSRLEREFAVVGQKLADAEEAIIDIEVSLRTYETGSRPRLPSPSAPQDKSNEKITARLRAVGDGISRFKEWVSKPKEGEGTDAPSKQPSGIRVPSRTGDLEDRLEEAVRSIAAEIKDREREAGELDRKLHDAQKELIRQRAQEQHARETQIKISQTRQLSEDLERKMALLDEMVRSIEAPMKADTGIRNKPKETGPGIPKIEDRLQTAVDEALKAVAAQEKKVADLEKEVERANAALVEERTRLQRIRAMQIRLRQARYFSTDLQRALDSLGGALDELRQRAGGLLRPHSKPAVKPPEPTAKP
jgi:DNA repair exonuclease SbcCD ATPase subunit